MSHFAKYLRAFQKADVLVFLWMHHNNIYCNISTDVHENG